MTHSVQLVIGRGPAMSAFVRIWSARSAPLKAPWQAVPMDEELCRRIEADAETRKRPPELDASPFGLEQALADATKEGGALAYVETDYWGGSGGQSAIAYVDGREAMAPQRSRGGGGPINQALRILGVDKRGGADEFDTIGLGERRTMDDYAPEGPRRLREGAGEAVAAKTTARGLPVWVVLLAIVGAIALGVAASIWR